jgi:hypothetical protein
MAQRCTRRDPSRRRTMRDVHRGTGLIPTHRGQPFAWRCFTRRIPPRVDHRKRVDRRWPDTPRPSRPCLVQSGRGRMTGPAQYERPTYYPVAPIWHPFQTGTPSAWAPPNHMPCGYLSTYCYQSCPLALECLTDASANLANGLLRTCNTPCQVGDPHSVGEEHRSYPTRVATGRRLLTACSPTRGTTNYANHPSIPSLPPPYTQTTKA